MSLVNTGTFEGLIRSLDTDPLRRGKQFEKITKWWLQNDPIHSRDVKKVWLWDEWPDRPGRDIGVDLVAEMRDGSLCAIQSKCFDIGRDIPKSELDSFVSAASTRTFKHRWLVASTDGLSANARRMLRDNHVTQILFSYLDSLEGFWPTSFDALGGTPTLVKASPRPHQQDAIRDVVEGLSKVSRGQLIMACGTGKTLTALWITEALEPSTTLVLIPSLSLLSQTLSEWAKNANTKWDYLCVCSDETVNKSDDAPISTTDDLPFDVTTKPADIAAFLERRGRKIIFSTYQSSAQVAKAQKTAGKKFDLVICDEAHRLTGKNDAEFATALDDTKIPAKKRLFMTATPRTYTASVKAKASERGVEITSMDDETVFGKELHKLSFGQAIEKELLTDYRVVIVGVTDPQVQELIDQRELVSVAGTVQTDARTLAAHIGLAKATKDYDLSRTISFHGRINSAQQFAQQHAAIVEWMPDNHKTTGTIWADTITGAMNSSERRKLLNKLKAEVPGQHALLSNARCLTEGVDVPSLDGVAFIDPRTSQVDIIQAVGRAIRKSGEKNLGTIVLPVLIPHDADIELALDDSVFKPIWAILNALKAHDEDFNNQINQLMTNLVITNKVDDLPTKLVLDFPIDINDTLPDFAEKFEIYLVNRTAETWSFWFGLLIKHVEQTGSAHVNQNEIVDGRSLGAWVTKQRTDRRRGFLSDAKSEKLEKLPFWTWEPNLDRRAELFNEIAKYVRQHNDARIPARFEQNGFGLGTFVSRLRKDFRSKSITDSEVHFLENLPGWTWDPLEDDWRAKYEELSNVIDSKKGKIPTYSPSSEHADLGKWVIDQRSRFKHNSLSPEQIQLLEQLPGWSWNPLTDRWTNEFGLLLDYVEREGNSRIPASLEFDGFPIGIWVSKQRVRFKNNRMPAEQIKKFEAISDWSWDPNDEKWNLRLSELSTFQIVNPMVRNGSIPKHLLDWMKDQRERYQNGHLDQIRIGQLEALPGWDWNPRDNFWEIVFNTFKDWASVNDIAKVPPDLLWAGANARSWIQNQRTRYRTKKLTKDQIDLLESVSGWTWKQRDDEWNRNYDLLAQALENDRQFNPQSSSPLGEWIRSQRRAWKSGSIEPSKIILLEQLANWTWTPKKIAVNSSPTSKAITTSWMDSYEVLSRYAKLNGTTILHVDTMSEEQRIGKWVSRQRQNYKSKTLSELQIQMLESLPKWSWSIR
jgi:superfamily II DNA or RNA helicase